jgi:hypothetical protein
VDKVQEVTASGILMVSHDHVARGSIVERTERWGELPFCFFVVAAG